MPHCRLGKVLQPGGNKQCIPGLYVSGWVKRGPTGIIGESARFSSALIVSSGPFLCMTFEILTTCTRFCAGTNLVDAQQTVTSIAEDVPHLPQPAVQEPGAAGVLKLLEAQGVQPVTFQEWERIDAKEVARGMAQGRPRDKFVDSSDMLRFLRMHVSERMP